MMYDLRYRMQRWFHGWFAVGCMLYDVSKPMMYEGKRLNIKVQEFMNLRRQRLGLKSHTLRFLSITGSSHDLDLILVRLDLVHLSINQN